MKKKWHTSQTDTKITLLNHATSSILFIHLPSIQLYSWILHAMRFRVCERIVPMHRRPDMIGTYEDFLLCSSDLNKWDKDVELPATRLWCLACIYPIRSSIVQYALADIHLTNVRWSNPSYNYYYRSLFYDYWFSTMNGILKICKQNFVCICFSATTRVASPSPSLSSAKYVHSFLCLRPCSGILLPLPPFCFRREEYDVVGVVVLEIASSLAPNHPK